MVVVVEATPVPLNTTWSSRHGRWKQYSGSLYVQSLRVSARVRVRVTAQALRSDQTRPDAEIVTGTAAATGREFQK